MRVTEKLTPHRHHLFVRLPLGQGHDARRRCLHHALIFFGVAVSVVYRRDAALAMIGDAVEGVATEAKSGHGRGKCSPQIVRGRALDAELGTDRAHRLIETARCTATGTGEHEARGGIAHLGQEGLHRGREPHPVRLRVLGAGASPSSAPALPASPTSRP